MNKIENPWTHEGGNQFIDLIEHDQKVNAVRTTVLHPALFEKFGDINGKRFLDGGSGEGTVGRFVEANGADLVSCDISNNALKKLIGKSCKPQSAVLMDLESPFPFKNESFDIVCYNLVLMWIPNIESLAKESQRILSTKGRLVVSVLHPWTALSKYSPDSENNNNAMNGNGSFRKNHVLRKIGNSAGPYPFYNRSISEYITTFTRNGFQLSPQQGIHEVTAPEESSFDDMKILPEFLILTFIK